MGGRLDSARVLYQACSGVETSQLPHPSCSRVASALWGSAVGAKTMPERPNSGTTRGRLPTSCTWSVWSGLSSTARCAFACSLQPNALLCCVVVFSWPSARPKFGSAVAETVTQLHQPSRARNSASKIGQQLLSALASDCTIKQCPRSLLCRRLAPDVDCLHYTEQSGIRSSSAAQADIPDSSIGRCVCVLEYGVIR